MSSREQDIHAKRRLLQLAQQQAAREQQAPCHVYDQLGRYMQTTTVGEAQRIIGEKDWTFAPMTEVRN